MDKPRRRYEIELHIGADNLRSVIGTLHSILFDLEQRQEDAPLSQVSGGYDCGYTLDATIDQSITHEIWERNLMDYLDEKKVEKAN